MALNLIKKIFLVGMFGISSLNCVKHPEYSEPVDPFLFPKFINLVEQDSAYSLSENTFCARAYMNNIPIDIYT